MFTVINIIGFLLTFKTSHAPKQVQQRQKVPLLQNTFKIALGFCKKKPKKTKTVLQIL